MPVQFGRVSGGMRGAHGHFLSMLASRDRLGGTPMRDAHCGCEQSGRGSDGRHIQSRADGEKNLTVLVHAAQCNPRSASAARLPGIKGRLGDTHPRRAQSRRARKAKGARGTGSNQHRKVPSQPASAAKTLEELGVSETQSAKPIGWLGFLAAITRSAATITSGR